ncbi:MAG: hypothetical protein IT537_28750 [Hyphomicrobiales bacterium]|nr:hypothetical protein [Hyphomicrobiales bacterium]
MATSESILVAAVGAPTLATGPLSGTACVGGGFGGGQGFGRHHNVDSFHGGLVTRGTDCRVLKQMPDSSEKELVCG